MSKGAGAEGTLPVVTDKPAEMRTAGMLTDAGDVNPAAPSAFHVTQPRCPAFDGVQAGEEIALQSMLRSFRQASRNAARAGSLRPLLVMGYNSRQLDAQLAAKASHADDRESQERQCRAAIRNRTKGEHTSRSSIAPST